jgi:hypothetical protein
MKKIYPWFLVVGGILFNLAGLAQTSSYFQAVTNLNPVGYWPMHEVEPPAVGAIETNYGTLGNLANGYYPDWVPANANPNIIGHQVPGALAGDTDTAVYFGYPNANNGTTSNALYVTHNSPLTTLNPPFSVECWFKATNGNAGDIWSQCGYEGLNSGASGGGGGAVGGIRLYWQVGAASPPAGFVVYSYAGNSTLQTLTATGTYTTNVWYHVVVTDDGTNINLFVNGNNVNSTYPYPHAGHYTPDYWTPFEVGNGRGNSRACKGFVDEVAIYNNVLQADDIATHYSAGTNSSPGPSYESDVLADSPAVYLRMDGPAYMAPAVAAWSVLNNYGSVGVNGVYSPGTVPGVVGGPNLNGVSFLGLSGLDVPALSGVSSYADVGYSPAYNPTGAVPFSITAMFRGNPCDNRYQDILGHSDNSWRIAMNTNGKLQCQLGTNTASTVNSVKVYNDGNWHQVTMVYTPGSGPAIPGTNALYVDGLLDNSVNSVSTNGILPGMTSDPLIAADPQYTNSPTGVGRQFAGQICEVAFFTNALSKTQITSFINALGMPLNIVQQPVAGNVNQGGRFTNTVMVAGSSPAYQWFLDGLAFPAQTNASLILNPVKSTDGGNYYVVITNLSGAVTSSVVALTVNSSPTILSQLPLAYTNQINLLSGASPSFSVTAGGAATLYYQWYSNAVAILYATNASLTLSNVQVTGSASYYCVASNFVGTASNTPVDVVVSAPTAPYPASVMALNPMGYWRLNEGPDNGNGNQGAVCFDYARGDNGTYTNTYLAEAGYDPATDPSETSAQFGYGYFSPDSDVYNISGVDFSAGSGSNASFTVEAWENGNPESADAAIVSRENYGNGGEQFVLDVHNGFYRFVVRDASGLAHAANSTISPTLGQWNHLAGVCDEVHGSISLYVNGALAASGPVASGSGILTVANGMTIGSRMSIANTNNNDQLHGNVNDVSVFATALSGTQVAAQYFGAGIAPSFTQLPSSVNVNQNSTLILPVSVAGTASMVEQWYDANTGLPILGQTNVTLVISNISFSDSYYLAVTNQYGTAVSPDISVSVNSGAPVIVQDLPATAVELAGRTHAYTVQVQGTAPFTYTWYNGASVIAGQTGPSYMFIAAAGNYSVAITNSYSGLVSTISALSVVTSPTDDYSADILEAGPVGYWPLAETSAPAPANLETNYGSLGGLGNAWYAATNSANIAFAQSGAIAGDSDTAVSFSGGSGNNPNSYAFVPRISPDLTIAAPFSLECWANPSTTTYGVTLGEGGGTGLNGGANFGGWQVGMGLNGGNNVFQMNYYTGSGSAQNDEIASGQYFNLSQWYHFVITYDGTNSTIYVDGSPIYTNTSPNAADTWSPLAIGAGKWDGGPVGGIRWFSGGEDEVAVYTNVLSATDINNHYQIGSTGSADYMQTILMNNPLLYYRMDNPAYVAPNPQASPTAINYGSAPVNAAYLAGTVPGEVAGPAVAPLGRSSLAAPINGVFSCVDAGNDPSFNPTGNHPMTAMAWFRTYPADGRLQSIMSHGGNTSWAIDLNGTNGLLIWSSGAGSVYSTRTYNDASWHQVVGVYDGITNYLYVDGVLNNVAIGTGSIMGNTNDDVFLGGDPDYTVVGGNEQYLAGSIAQEAFFTNALNAAQIKNLYIVATVPIVSVSYSAGQVIIKYTGSLLSSTNADGPYAKVVDATSSPYMVPSPAVKMFYRSSNP